MGAKSTQRGLSQTPDAPPQGARRTAAGPGVKAKTLSGQPTTRGRRKPRLRRTRNNPLTLPPPSANCTTKSLDMAMSNDLELISSAMQNGNSGKKTGTAGNTTTLAATTPGKQAPTARSIPLNGNIRKPNQPRLSAFATEQEKIKDQFGANNSEEEESSDEEEPGNNAGMEASN
ncbi:hypothetical protein PCANC_07743, partial [Puccinia coronata f. sp. avenae]